MTTDKIIDIDKTIFFSTKVYSTELPEYIELIKKVSEGEIYDEKNSVMSYDISSDERISEFSKLILQISWDFLQDEGYSMNDYYTAYESMWIQDHPKNSWMPQHTHSNGNQIVGFYFLEVPENSCKLLLHDPRPGKLQINLNELDPEKLTSASAYVTIRPSPGQLILTPAWLAHTFTPNNSNDNFKFVHMNIQAIEVKKLKNISDPIVI